MTKTIDKIDLRSRDLAKDMAPLYKTYTRLKDQWKRDHNGGNPLRRTRIQNTGKFRYDWKYIGEDGTTTTPDILLRRAAEEVQRIHETYVHSQDTREQIFLDGIVRLAMEIAELVLTTKDGPKCFHNLRGDGILVDLWPDIHHSTAWDRVVVFRRRLRNLLRDTTCNWEEQVEALKRVTDLLKIMEI